MVLAAAAVVAIGYQQQRPETGPDALATLSADPTAGLPPTAAGRPGEGYGTWSASPATDLPRLQPDDSGDAGSTVRGRVSQVYVRMHDNVFLAADRAPRHLHNPEQMFVEIEYPDLLRNGSGTTRAKLSATFDGVGVGDVVSVRLAHKHNPKFFPVRETTRVTELVARRNSELARAYENRIMARTTGAGLLAAQPERAPALRDVLAAGGTR